MKFNLILDFFFSLLLILSHSWKRLKLRDQYREKSSRYKIISYSINIELSKNKGKIPFCYSSQTFCSISSLTNPIIDLRKHPLFLFCIVRSDVSQENETPLICFTPVWLGLQGEENIDYWWAREIDNFFSWWARLVRDGDGLIFWTELSFCQVLAHDEFDSTFLSPIGSWCLILSDLVSSCLTYVHNTCHYCHYKHMIHTYYLLHAERTVISSRFVSFFT